MSGFREQHALLLPRWLPSSVLGPLMEAAARGPWVPDTVTGRAFSFSVLDADLGPLLAPLMAPELVERLQELTGITGLRRFQGQIKCLGPEPDQRFPWHRDHRAGQLLGLSVNLSPRPYQGGAFEIRWRWQQEPLCTLKPENPGDTHLIDVADPRLVHRVTPLTGREPRLFLAGWYFGDDDDEQC